MPYPGRVGLLDGRRLVPCRGGPGDGYGLLVPEPLPVEVHRGPGGLDVLDDAGAEPAYVWVEDHA